MRKALSIVFIGFLHVISFSQTQNSAYTAVGKGVATTFLTDYQALGINNSALGWGNGFDDKKFTLGTSELNIGIESQALSKDRLVNAFESVLSRANGSNTAPFNTQQQIDAALDYADAGVSIFANYNWFGAAYQTEKFGGIAVSVTENYSWFSRLNEQTSDLVFRGSTSSYFDSLGIAINGDTSIIANSPNLSGDTLSAVFEGRASNPLLLSELTDGTRVKFLWNRFYNFGYGRKIFGNDSTFALYAGVGGRFIQSMAMFDMESDAGELNVNSSISPFFNLNYANGVNDPNEGIIPESIGQGFGYDFSASVILLDKIKIAAAVNNVGSVTYNRNVYTVRDTLLDRVSIDGLDDTSIPASLNQFNEEGGLLNLEGQQEVVVQNASNMRLGGSIHLSEKLHVGFDVVAPFNRDNPGSLQNPVFSVGGDFRPVKWLQLSAGYFGGGIYANNIPLGINFILKGGVYEFGISSQNALSFVLQDANSLSAAFGFARFRF
jgi:hypothetical protein